MESFYCHSFGVTTSFPKKACEAEATCFIYVHIGLCFTFI